jgi:hypothetical protein
MPTWRRYWCGLKRAWSGRRAELVGPDTAALAVEADQIIFGDLDTRFTELVGLLLDIVARMRADGSRAVVQ